MSAPFKRFLLPLVASVTRFLNSFRLLSLPLLIKKTSPLAVKTTFRGCFYPCAQLSYNPNTINMSAPFGFNESMLIIYTLKSKELFFKFN